MRRERTFFSAVFDAGVQFIRGCSEKSAHGGDRSNTDPFVFVRSPL